MSTIVIANCNKVLGDIQNELATKYNAEIINENDDLTLEKLELIQPDYVFFLHWSWIISEAVYKRFNCVVFHMTDLPFGRGGSPLQNLLIRGLKETKISALKVDKGIDTGDIYMKRGLNLNGTAQEIFIRSGNIIKEMIADIIANDPVPTMQVGEPVYFKRRTPSESLITGELSRIPALYDFIRMLDAENYPNAFIENEHFKFEFTGAEIINEKELRANVRIIKK